MEQIFVSRYSSWSPPADNIYKSPDLSFCDPLFRRRLSQISKMTIQVVHDILPVDEETKMFFVSFRGEVSRQFSINKMVIEDKEISPAAFSMSTFNAPAALASMAFGLKGGYCAVYPGNNSLAEGLAAAQAALIAGTNSELIFVYADEAVPQEYSEIVTENPAPLAFALLLKKANDGTGKPLCMEAGLTPQEFLNKLTL